MGVIFGILEVDIAPNREDLQQVLRHRSGQTAVTEVYVHGNHVGGADELVAAAASGELKEMLTNASVAFNNNEL